MIREAASNASTFPAKATYQRIAGEERERGGGRGRETVRFISHDVGMGRSHLDKAIHSEFSDAICLMRKAAFRENTIGLARASTT